MVGLKTRLKERIEQLNNQVSYIKTIFFFSIKFIFTVSLKLKGKIYDACVQRVLVYGPFKIKAEILHTHTRFIVKMISFYKFLIMVTKICKIVI